MLKQRVITAIILASVFLPAMFKLPETGWLLLVGIIVMLGAWEWLKLAKMRGLAAVIYLLLTLMMYLVLVWIYFNLPPQQIILPRLIIYGVAAVFWVVIVPAWFIAGWKPDSLLLMGIVGWLVLLPTGMAMLDLRAENPQPWWLLGVMGLVWVADISAYTAGRKFGRHKLAPAISPGKTWEGVAGAMLGVLVYMVIVMRASGMTQHYAVLLYAIVGVALAVIGDLFESAIKRQAGVKDSGKLLPGHGGILDRVDALTSTLPLAALALLLARYS